MQRQGASRDAAGLFHHAHAHPQHAFLGDPGHVRRQDDIGQRQERVISWQGLCVKHVNRRPAQMPRSKCRDQRLFDHHRPARHIDQNCPGAHPRKRCRIDQTARLVGQWRAECKDIRICEKSFQTDMRNPRGQPGAAAGMADHLHAKAALRHRRQRPPDGAHAQHTQHATRNFTSMVGMRPPGRPTRAAQVAVHLRVASQKRHR